MYLPRMSVIDVPRKLASHYDKILSEILCLSVTKIRNDFRKQFRLVIDFSYDTIQIDYPELEVPERIGGNSIYYRTMQIDED